MFRAHVSFLFIMRSFSLCSRIFRQLFQALWAMRVSALEPSIRSFRVPNNGSGASRAISMTDAHRFKTYADDEIDLRELFLVLWRGKGLITMVTGLAAIVSVVMALSMPNIYQSTAVLAPKSGGGTGGLSRLASQYGGLASLAGINLGGLGSDGMSKPAIALEK